MKIEPKTTIRYDELKNCENIVTLKEMDTSGCYALLYRNSSGKHFIVPEKSKADAELVLKEAGLNDAEYISTGFTANDNAFIHVKSLLYALCEDGSEYDVVRNYDGCVCALPHFAAADAIPTSKQCKIKFDM